MDDNPMMPKRVTRVLRIPDGVRERYAMAHYELATGRTEIAHIHRHGTEWVTDRECQHEEWREIPRSAIEMVTGRTTVDIPPAVPFPECQCEHFSHFDDNPGHPYGAPMSGSWACGIVGWVCTFCARDHMTEYLIGRRPS